MRHRLMQRPKPPLASTRRRGLAVFATIALLVPSAAGLASCGQDSEATSAEIERRIERERAEAARLARQDERIKQLEKQVRDARNTPKSGAAGPSSNGGSGGGASSLPPSVPSSGSTSDWPGGSGYTVVLASEQTEGAARATQRAATQSGLDAGLLQSSNYSSLRAGYWVVFSGKFQSSESAAQRQSRARSLGYGDAYVRFVAP